MFDTQEIIDTLNWATMPIHVSQEYRTLYQQTIPYRDKIGEAFSTSFVDSLDDLENRLNEITCAEHFARGFWLGLRLGQFAEQGPRGRAGDL